MIWPGHLDSEWENPDAVTLFNKQKLIAIIN